MNTHPLQCTTSLFHEDVGGISCSTAGKCDRLVIYRSFFVVVEQNDKTLEVWGNNEWECLKILKKVNEKNTLLTSLSSHI